MAKKKAKVWEELTGTGSYACDQCGEDYSPRCETCDHLIDGIPKLYTNGESVLCESCYPLTLVEYYDKVME
jgi:hypothetical protein